MNSRPARSLSQRQPPKRSLSSANLIRRPTPQRTLSQQYPPASTARRSNEGFADVTIDGSGPAAQGGRYGTIPRNGGSNLKLELSEDSTPSDLVESPKLNYEATPAWRPSAPPRGRPQLHFDVPSVSNTSFPAAQGKGQTPVPIKPMPLPTRPGQHAPPPALKSRVVPASSVKKDARPKPYTLEVPAAAPRYSTNGHSDFFPWTGNHPEDQFSDNAIRKGFNKAKMTHNETRSAKASVVPALKHKTGLQALSSLFTNVLAQRRANGQITSASTFKPPPRVTVTDTKREIWLKDLANPIIPLRRLSRSIPHGIRGKVLLDQSLSKNIPIERAVWLAKCVGANDLRSFRRKGASGTFAMGGEPKWIRDFTVCVEQFVDNTVSLCGEEDFRSKINYAIRLAAKFYAEYLLDREHYMDWLVSSIENSQQSKLPMWLLITQIYWKDLLKHRKYGRRLAMALTNQLAEMLNHPDNDILAPLSERLQRLIKDLMASNPDSFISPKEWISQRGALQPWLALENARYSSIFSSIDRRNLRLVKAGAETNPPPPRRLMQILDATLSKLFDNDLPKTYWRMDRDKSVVMQTVLQWSTSSHRPGNAKIYAAARILRYCSKSGGNVSEAILRFMDSRSCESGCDKPAFYHLVSELARSEHFSAATYLQWLIARGGIYDPADVSRGGPCASRLLAEMPTHIMSDSLIALRTTLLGRAGFSVEDEEKQTNVCISLMNDALPGMHSNDDSDMELSVPPGQDFEQLNKTTSRSSKSEMGLWLRHKVKLQILQSAIPPLDEWDNSSIKGGASTMTASTFNIVREYLERVDDYSMLADVLKIVTTSDDPEVLASCADTLDLHLDIFAAIGALKGLFDTLMARLRSMNDGTDSIPRVFLVSLSDLAARLPDQKITAQQLANELDRSDRKTAADACSPVSDHMALIQTAEADFTDEIEKILASGNSMDQSTLERLFQRIALRLEESWLKLPEQHRSCGLLFTRLRTFDAQQFDLLMISWVSRFLQMLDRPSMMHVLGPLISFGCLTLKDVVMNGGAIFESLASLDPAKMALAQELLSLSTSPSVLPEVMTAEEAYRLRIKQSHLQKDNFLETLTIIRRALDCPYHTTEHPLLKSIGDKDSTVYQLLQRLALVDTDAMTKSLVLPLLRSGIEDASASIVNIVDRLLAADRYEAATKSITIDVVIHLANDFTLPFCQVKLASMFALEETTMKDAEEDGSQLLQALDTAIETAVNAHNTSWTCIVPLLDISIAQHVHQRAARQLLTAFPNPKATNLEGSMQDRVKQAENLLYIVEATADSIATPSAAISLGPEIISTLSNLWQLISNTQNAEMKELLIKSWTPLLLTFITLQASVFEATKSGNETRAKVILGLTGLLLELQALDTSAESVSTIIEQTFDLALYLIDSLPDELRQQCIRSLRDTASSSRVSYLFSISANPSDWLFLSQKKIATSTSAAEPRGSGSEKKKFTPFALRRWEMLGEPTPNVGENDTSLSLTLFGARKC